MKSITKAKPAAKCTARTASGGACHMPAQHDSAFCFAHDPQRQAERTAARKIGGFNRRIAARVSGDAVQIKTLSDVLALVNAVIQDVWVMDNTAERGRVLLSAADMSIKALSAGDIETRLAALEASQQTTGAK